MYIKFGTPTSQIFVWRNNMMVLQDYQHLNYCGVYYSIVNQINGFETNFDWSIKKPSLAGPPRNYEKMYIDFEQPTAAS